MTVPLVFFNSFQSQELQTVDNIGIVSDEFKKMHEDYGQVNNISSKCLMCWKNSQQWKDLDERRFNSE